jgi:putative peptidoglycan lipid II flippase
MNFFKIESYKKGIAVSSIFNFFAKIISFGNSIVIAYYFGTQGKTDVYVYSFATISLISAFLTNLNGLILIPESMRIREQEGLLKSMHFLNWFIYIFLFIGLVFTLVLYINPVKSFIFFSKFDSELLRNNVDILFCVIPMLTLVVLSSLFTEILVSFKYFTLPMMAGMINSVLSIVFVAVFHARLDILSITTGLLAGFALNIIILVFLLRKQLNWDFRIKKIKIRKQVFKNIFYAQAGNITTVLGTYIPLYLISGFNQGVVTALNYGRNLANIPDQLITIQFSSIFGIKLNEVFATGEVNRSNNVFLSSVNMLFFILVPVSIIMSFFSKEIVTILYMRGKFDVTSVESTSQFLKYFSLSLPFIALNTLSSRIITASQRISLNFYIGAALNIFFLVLLFIFVRAIGPVGYPIALLIFLPFSTLIVNYFIFKRYFVYIKYCSIILLLVKIVLINLLIAIPCLLIYKSYLFRITFYFSVPVICVIYLFALIIINNYLKINLDIISLHKKLRTIIRNYQSS